MEPLSSRRAAGSRLASGHPKGLALMRAHAEYVWLGNEPVALFTPNGTNAPNVFYVHADHLGAPRVIVNTANQLRWRWLAEPFATTAPETNPQALGAFTFNLRLPGQCLARRTG